MADMMDWRQPFRSDTTVCHSVRVGERGLIEGRRSLTARETKGFLASIFPATVGPLQFDRRRLLERGWVFVRGGARNLVDLGTSFGAPIRSRPSHRGVVDILQPATKNQARPSSLSSRFGLEQFPFHTDLAHFRQPARYILMAALKDSSTATLLIDTKNWALSASERLRLMHEAWFFAAGHERFLACILQEGSTGSFIFRYDREVMTPMIAAHAIDSIRIVERRIQASRPIRITWNMGDILVFDNWRILHGRGTHNPAVDRCLLRMQIGTSS